VFPAIATLAIAEDIFVCTAVRRTNAAAEVVHSALTSGVPAGVPVDGK